MMRSPVKLKTGWHEIGREEYPEPNCVAEAARALGGEDARVGSPPSRAECPAATQSSTAQTAAGDRPGPAPIVAGPARSTHGGEVRADGDAPRTRGASAHGGGPPAPARPDGPLVRHRAVRTRRGLAGSPRPPPGLSSAPPPAPVAPTRARSAGGPGTGARTQASAARRSRTSANRSFASNARPACPSRLTCPPRSATTRMTPWRTVRWGRWGWPASTNGLRAARRAIFPPCGFTGRRPGISCPNI